MSVRLPVCLYVQCMCTVYVYMYVCMSRYGDARYPNLQTPEALTPYSSLCPVRMGVAQRHCGNRLPGKARTTPRPPQPVIDLNSQWENFKLLGHTPLAILEELEHVWARLLKKRVQEDTTNCWLIWICTKRQTPYPKGPSTQIVRA